MSTINNNIDQVDDISEIDGIEILTSDDINYLYETYPFSFTEMALQIFNNFNDNTNNNRLDELLTREAIENSITETTITKTKKVIHTEDIKLLKKTRYKNLIDTNNECAITSNTFEDDDIVINLPCNHTFEANGILNWLQNHNAECPLCRYKFKNLTVSYNTNIDINTNIIPYSASKEELNSSKYKIDNNKKKIDNKNNKNNINNNKPIIFMNMNNNRRKYNGFMQMILR